MNVSLGTKWERFVEEKVTNGDYQTASEVLREGLRLLEKEELLKRISVQSLPDLEAKLIKAVQSIEEGRRIDGKAVMADLRAKRQTRCKNG